MRSEEYYLERAEELRTIADSLTTYEVKEEYLRIIAQCEREAERAKRFLALEETRHAR